MWWSHMMEHCYRILERSLMVLTLYNMLYQLFLAHGQNLQWQLLYNLCLLHYPYPSSHYSEEQTFFDLIASDSTINFKLMLTCLAFVYHTMPYYHQTWQNDINWRYSLVKLFKATVYSLYSLPNSLVVMKLNLNTIGHKSLRTITAGTHFNLYKLPCTGTTHAQIIKRYGYWILWDWYEMWVYTCQRYVRTYIKYFMV